MSQEQVAKVARYAGDGHWFRGATHTHSTASDGALPPAEMHRLYGEAGYDFLFLTDHDVTSDLESLGGPILGLNAAELSQAPGEPHYHLLAYGISRQVPRSLALPEKIEAIHGEGGLAVFAHPYWSGTPLDYFAGQDIDGVEIYNHAANWLNGKGLSLPHWETLLQDRPFLTAFAGDDDHHQPHEPALWRRAWVMAKARTLDKPSIMESLRRGDFYATQGPRFESIDLDGDAVRIRTSEVREIRLVGRGSAGKRLITPDPEATFTGAEFSLKGWNGFARLEIMDAQGRLAWSNGLHRPEA
ncbi:MAG: CehA/McbA family metallohydrolase [Spirochaetes bacterium]|nr:CehA/McbA family metallohydrolase [Spirochaetota bacterium]